MDRKISKALDWIYEHANKEDFVKAVVKILKDNKWEEVVNAKGCRTSQEICNVWTSIENIIKTLHEYGLAENFVSEKVIDPYKFIRKYYPHISSGADNRYALRKIFKENNIEEKDYSLTELANIINEKQDIDFEIVQFCSGDAGMRIIEIPK